MDARRTLEGGRVKRLITTVRPVPTARSASAVRAWRREASAALVSMGTETGFYLSQGLSRFAAPLFCEGAVVEVFPQLAVRLEIDHDSGLLPGFVHEETDSRNHRPTFNT
jgi:hypothetical protein